MQKNHLIPVKQVELVCWMGRGGEFWQLSQWDSVNRE